MLQCHRNFWNNSPGIVLRRTESISGRDPLRTYIHDQDIKGEFTAEMVDVERIVDHIARIYQGLPLLDGDVFQCASFASVVPWMEAIIGCQIHSAGKRGVSMVANPIDIEPGGLPQYLHCVLDNIEENAWFKKLGNGYQALTQALGAEFPIVQSLLRGPGDMLGALLGHEDFICRMMKPADNEALLNELLDLCARIYIKTAKMELERSERFNEGYCNGWGIWAPGLNVRTQEDEAALVSPQLYNRFLLPYHIQEVAAFDYSTFHMHSGYLRSIYNWRDFSRKSTITAFEVVLDPNGPAVEDLMETLLAINSEKPLIIDVSSDEHAQKFEEYLQGFPGSIFYNRIILLDVRKQPVK